MSTRHRKAPRGIHLLPHILADHNSLAKPTVKLYESIDEKQLKELNHKGYDF